MVGVFRDGGPPFPRGQQARSWASKMPGREYELASGVLNSLWKWLGVDHSVQDSCREHVYDPSHMSVPKSPLGAGRVAVLTKRQRGRSLRELLQPANWK